MGIAFQLGLASNAYTVEGQVLARVFSAPYIAAALATTEGPVLGYKPNKVAAVVAAIVYLV